MAYATFPALATLLWDTTGSGSYSAVLSTVIDIEAGEKKIGSSRISGLGAPDRTYQYMSGWINNGEIKIKALFFSTEYNNLDTVSNLPPGAVSASTGGASSTKTWAIRYNDGITSATTGTQLIFQGHITSLKNTKADRDSDDPIMTEVSIMPSGIISVQIAT